MPTWILTGLAVAIGSAIGGLSRFGLTRLLHGWWGDFPLGTLVSNLVGGYIAGLALAFFTQMPQLSPEWRLFVITGFCGGLTTFSSFSLEVLSLFQHERPLLALLMISLHVVGAILFAYAGYSSWQGFRS